MHPVWLQYVVPPEASWTPSSPGPSVLETSVSVSRISGVQYDQYGPEELCQQCNRSLSYACVRCLARTVGAVSSSVMTTRLVKSRTVRSQYVSGFTARSPVTSSQPCLVPTRSSPSLSTGRIVIVSDNMSHQCSWQSVQQQVLLLRFTLLYSRLSIMMLSCIQK